jgi:hypothetical protein
VGNEDSVIDAYTLDQLMMTSVALSIDSPHSPFTLQQITAYSKNSSQHTLLEKSFTIPTIPPTCKV